MAIDWVRALPVLSSQNSPRQTVGVWQPIRIPLAKRWVSKIAKNAGFAHVHLRATFGIGTRATQSNGTDLRLDVGQCAISEQDVGSPLPPVFVRYQEKGRDSHRPRVYLPQRESYAGLPHHRISLKYLGLYCLNILASRCFR
jgi:hypothetical protein